MGYNGPGLVVSVLTSVDISATQCEYFSDIIVLVSSHSFDNFSSF